MNDSLISSRRAAVYDDSQCKVLCSGTNRVACIHNLNREEDEHTQAVLSILNTRTTFASLYTSLRIVSTLNPT